MTAPNPRALAERHGLSFHLEQRVPDHLTLVHHKQGCRPATDGETQLWTALARYALDREAECERLREAMDDLKWSTLLALRKSLETEILPGIRAGAQAWEAQRAERAVRVLIDALPPPPRGAATGDDDGR